MAPRLVADPSGSPGGFYSVADGYPTTAPLDITSPLVVGPHGLVAVPFEPMASKGNRQLMRAALEDTPEPPENVNALDEELGAIVVMQLGDVAAYIRSHEKSMWTSAWDE